MMGAQKARTLVKNHWRHATMSSVFFVRIHVWLRIAMAVVVAPVGALEEGTTDREGFLISHCGKCRYYRLRDEGGSHASNAPVVSSNRYSNTNARRQKVSSGGESSTQMPTSESRVQESRIQLPSGNILSSSSFASRDTPD